MARHSALIATYPSLWALNLDLMDFLSLFRDTWAEHERFEPSIRFRPIANEFGRLFEKRLGFKRRNCFSRCYQLLKTVLPYYLFFGHF